MINLLQVVKSPKLSQPFEIYRKEGGFMNEGRWVEGNPVTIPARGVIQPASAYDILNFVPEGERTDNMIRCYSEQEARLATGDGQMSDYIIWRGGYYKVVFAKFWVDYGYWQALASQVDGSKIL